MCCMRFARNTGRKKSLSVHHCTTLSGYVFVTKARIDNRKKLVKQQYLLQMSLQYGELRPTDGWDLLASLGHLSKFQRVSRLGSALLHGTLVVGVSQTLRRSTEGATCIWQGGHHVGHWPTFLVTSIITLTSKQTCKLWLYTNDLTRYTAQKQSLIIRK